MNTEGKMRLADEDVAFVRDLVRSEAAIVLDVENAYWVQARLTPVARQRRLDSARRLIDELRLRSKPRDLVAQVVDAMTTNETAFFRDFALFETLRTSVLPDLMARRSEKQELTVWCAAASSGQEPYSLCMLLRAHFPELATWNITCLASDVSSTMLKRARAGQYTQLEVNRGLPASMLAQFFEETDGAYGVIAAIRDLIDFQQINLVREWPALPRFDLVLARNVLMYFDPPTRGRLLQAFRHHVAPDGYFVLGRGELPPPGDGSFAPAGAGHPAVFRPAAG